MRIKKIVLSRESRVQKTQQRNAARSRLTYLSMNLTKEDKAFIAKHLNDDTSKLMLAVPQERRWLVHQIIARKKATKKLPSWVQNEDIIFPQSLSLEQSSSEITAQCKSNLVAGKMFIDTTGGMGIDSYYFSQQVENVIYIEQNSELAEIAKHNFEVLGQKNITVINQNCIEFLQNYSQKVDWIYIDPARRSSEQQRVSKLSDCEPDVTQVLPLFFNKSNKVLIKASPFLDIQQAIRELKNLKNSPTKIVY